MLNFGILRFAYIARIIRDSIVGSGMIVAEEIAVKVEVDEIEKVAG
jgi:hypothetical protein